MPLGGKRQYSIVGVAVSGMIQHVTNGFLQGQQLERFAQDPKLRSGRLHHVAVAAGEQNRNLRISVVDFLCQGDPIHAARHDNIAEHKGNLVGALQPVAPEVPRSWPSQALRAYGAGKS